MTRTAIFLSLLIISSAMTVTSYAERRAGIGMVAEVHWPEQPGNYEYTVAKGDLVTGRIGNYRPPRHIMKTDKNQVFNIIKITKAHSRGEIVIIYDGTGIEKPQLKEVLGRLETDVFDIGFSDKDVTIGDSVQIETYNLDGRIYVSVNVTRGEQNEQVANFSFKKILLTFRTNFWNND